MSGYLADFITGRSIGESDRIVAVAIVPTEGGWPDAVCCQGRRACAVYPHDRICALSEIEEDAAEPAARAAIIVMDSSERLVVDGDLMFMTQAGLGGSARRATFEAFAGFQRLAVGLSVLNRYFAPSCFTRSDSLFEAVDFQLASINSAVKGISSKSTYGPECGEERGERLAALARSLSATLEAVEWEMVGHPACAGYKAAMPALR